MPPLSRSTSAFTLLVGAGASALAATEAPKSGIRWERDYETAFAEAKERNVAVMIAFIQDGEAQNEQEPAEVYPNSKVIKASRALVNLVASQGSARDHGEVKILEDGEARTVCAKFGGVSCAEHQRVERRAFLEFTKGTIDTPAHVFVTPDGKELFRGDDFVDAGELIRLMEQAAAEVGPGVDRDEYEAAQAAFLEGEGFFARDAFGAAAAKYRPLAAKAFKTGSFERARERLAEIDKQGAVEISGADLKSSGKDLLGAYFDLMRIARAYKGVRAEKEARARLSALEKSPEAGEVLKVSALEKKARPILDQADEQFGKRSYDKAAALYQKVVDTYPSTPAALHASEQVRRIHQDPNGARQRQAEATSRECIPWLGFAREYLKSGNKAKAEEFARRVIEKYPDSVFAKHAEKLIQEIRTGGG